MAVHEKGRCPFCGSRDLRAMDFLSTLRERNAALFWYGAVCLAFALFCLVVSATSTTQVNGVNAWIKPFKFALSTTLFVWAMGWYMNHLTAFDHRWYDWTTIALLSFEIGYIAWRAYRGERSHFNVGTPAASVLWSLMALAITLVTLYTAYVGAQFFSADVAPMPTQQLWAIRAGIILFVVFAFEGFVMGARMSHAVGGPEGTLGLPLLHWSYTVGDLRAAHFIGMHALQVLPLLACSVIGSARWTAVAIAVYTLLAVVVLVLALSGRPVVKAFEPRQPGSASRTL
jgi:hypothetical protein